MATRPTKNEAVAGVCDYKVVTLTAATPVPAGSDILNASSTAIVAGDLTIRDTAAHQFVIPLASAGWRKLLLRFRGSVFDQAATIQIYSATSVMQFGTLPAGVAIFNLAPNNPAGASGSQTYASQNQYPLPAVEGNEKVTLYIGFSVAPTSGSFTIDICRST